jgi:hypothetical protein
MFHAASSFFTRAQSALHGVFRHAHAQRPGASCAGERGCRHTSLAPHSLVTHTSLTRHSHVTHTSRTRHSHLTHTSLTPHSHVTHTSLTRHSHLTHTSLTRHSLVCCRRSPRWRLSCRACSSHPLCAFKNCNSLCRRTWLAVKEISTDEETLKQAGTMREIITVFEY